MTPLIILIVTFFVLWSADRLLLGGKFGTSGSGRGAMAVMLIATGIAHFTSTEPMVRMMPEFVPYKRELVWFTGICEFAGALGLLWPKTTRLAAVMLIIFFFTILPANIAGSLKAVEFGGMENGPWYLLFRVPLQLFFILWVWWFGIRDKVDS